MILVLHPNVPEQEIQQLADRIRANGLRPEISPGVERTIIHVLGNAREEFSKEWESVRCVEKVIRILKPYKLASQEHHVQKTKIPMGKQTLGGSDFVVIAGPCSVESEAQILQSGQILKDFGIGVMRASAFKPRTSPYEFQGLGLEGLRLLRLARERLGILVETEVMDVRDVAVAAEYVDVLRIGARNMQNFDLLKEVGRVDKPIILKRGMAATIKEFIMAAEYILSTGNRNVILCERGIRTFETAYRNTLDLGAVAMLKKETHLPVIVDPSHAAGNREFVPALSKAALAVGADGLLVEMHPNPELAMSDGAQSLFPDQLKTLLAELKPLATALGRTM